VSAHFDVLGGYAAENRGADFVQHLVPSRWARRNKALDPTALLGASGCKHPGLLRCSRVSAAIRPRRND
jgi:hypothetical protein